MTYLISGNSLMASVSGQTYSLTSDHPHYNTIRDALLAGEPDDQIVALFDAAMAASKFMHGEVEARAGVLYYKGEAIHNFVATRILDFMSKGIPYQPLVELLKRLQKNPSKHSVDEAYRFIEKNNLPITEDGCILGYKGVNNDWTDCYTSKVDNRIGATPRMERNTVDDNWRVLCSSGYHVGSLDYARGFGARTIIVKVDPADCVAVPEGEESWKMRVCAYEVVAECKGELPKTVAVSTDPYREESAVLSFLKRLFGIKS